MSQNSDISLESGAPTGGAETNEQNESLFDEGFALGGDSNGNGQSGAQDAQQEEFRQPQAEPNQQATERPKVEDVHTYIPQPTYHVPEVQHDAPQGAPTPSPSPAKTVAVPEKIAEELQALRNLNPDAADLAMEDSPEGASIRSRLEQYGAELAQDRAERVLWQREQDKQREQAEANRMEQAREAHNATFVSTLQRDHPDYMAMISDPSRKAESVQYQQGVFSWIASKPYAEAAQLMEIARSGRDPAQVSALLTQFEQERGKQPKGPDPTGALAVPGKGAPLAPSGVGDKDSFDAGWDLNLSK